MNIATHAGRLMAGLILGVLCACGDDPAPSPGSLEVSPTALEFGDVPRESTESLELTLKNSGGTALELQSVTLTSGLQSVFNVQWERIGELEPGASTTVTVAFTPNKEDDFTGVVQVRSTDPENPSIYVDLTGTGTASTKDADQDGYSPATGDCNDGDGEMYPGNDEVCDGKNNDCKDGVPADESNNDGDAQRPCSGDCDDGDKTVYTGATEVCDQQDNDCDGTNADDGDGDEDGYSICEGDCDDREELSYPGNTETCGDKVDNDCDGKADNLDADRDGYSQCDVLGDCSDNDATRHPFYVDAAFRGSGEGTPAAPFTTLGAALEALDDAGISDPECRQIYVAAGDYTVTTQLDDPNGLTIIGAAAATVQLRPDGEDRLFYVTRGHLTLEKVTITAGDSRSGTGGTTDGGAILADDADVTLRSVIAHGNTAGADGGAVAVQSGAALTLEDCTFTSNTAFDEGGAVAALNSAIVDSGSTYQGNQGAQGGALSIQASSATLSGLHLQGNVANKSGGGISAIAVSTGFRLERSTFWLNSAGRSGGAVDLDNVSDGAGYIRNCLVQNNSAGETGGGFSLAGVTGLTLHNNTLTENVSAGNGAGAILRKSQNLSTTAVDFLGNLLAFNDGASGLYVETTGSTIEYNTVFATTSGTSFDYGGEVTVGASTGNDQKNPSFTYIDTKKGSDPASDDLTLAPGSPAINAGPADSSYNDPNGSRNDRGAYGGPHALTP